MEIKKISENRFSREGDSWDLLDLVLNAHYSDDIFCKIAQEKGSNRNYNQLIEELKRTCNI